MNLKASNVKSDLLYLTKKKMFFSNIYTSVRNKEGRILRDKEVSKLPFVSLNTPHTYEWKLRQKSTKRITDYLYLKNTKLNILDVGCGNGWFSNAMAVISDNHYITGLDVNIEELKQATRVFKNNNLQFVYGDIFKISGFEQKYDIITLNACVQYFPDFKTLIKTLKSFLKTYGEIHIIDSPFYKSEEIIKAKKRTKIYYKNLGYPEMAKNYFHHKIEDLQDFNILYQPQKSFINKILRKKDSPFMWLKFSK